MKEKIVIIGCSRKGKEVKEFIERYDLFDVIGFSVNRKYIKESVFEGLPVYPLEELDTIIDKNEVYTFVASSHFNYLNRVKRDLYTYLKANGYKVANLISPNATVRASSMGEGNWITDFAYLAEDVEFGSNNTMRPYSYIAHYCQIGDHNFFGIRSLLAGGIHMGNQNFVGLNATIFNSVHVGNKCIIGAGTVIKKHVKDFCMCRVAGDSVEVHEYDSEGIEKKLGPMDKFERKTYDTIQHH